VARLEIVETPLPEALGEEDLVEMSSDVLESVPPPPVQPMLGGDLDFEDEAAPASSQRQRLASRGDLLADASREPVALDEGREVPIKTPPPESGPQEAVLPMGLAAPPAPNIDALLASDIPPISLPTGVGPRPEQLGQTIELEEGLGPDLELDAPAALPTPPPPSSQELEVRLPEREAVVGRFDQDLLPPPEARDDLRAQRERSDLFVGSPELTAATQPTHPPLETTTLPAPGFMERPAPEPELVERPPISGISPIVVSPVAPVRSRPATFAALLDASIELGG